MLFTIVNLQRSSAVISTLAPKPPSNQRYQYDNAAVYQNSAQRPAINGTQATLFFGGLLPRKTHRQHHIQYKQRAAKAWSRLPTNGAKWKASQWLESTAQTDVAVPLEHAWALWEDREKIPQWMPWITSVTVLDDDPRMSRWTLSTYQFERQWQFSWLAQNMTPLKNQKIHWRSVPGSVGGNVGQLEIQNRGQIRFARKGPSMCSVRLTISYEVPNVLAPFAQLLTPVVEGILSKDMQRFREYAAELYAKEAPNV